MFLNFPIPSVFDFFILLMYFQSFFVTCYLPFLCLFCQCLFFTVSVITQLLSWCSVKASKLIVQCKIKGIILILFLRHEMNNKYFCGQWQDFGSVTVGFVFFNITSHPKNKIFSIYESRRYVLLPKYNGGTGIE